MFADRKRGVGLEQPEESAATLVLLLVVYVLDLELGHGIVDIRLLEGVVLLTGVLYSQAV